MSIKFASTMKAHVIIITTSLEKGKDTKLLEADEVLISKDKDQMNKHTVSFDFLFNTISVSHDLNQYIPIIKKVDATITINSYTVFKNHGHNKKFL